MDTPLLIGLTEDSLSYWFYGALQYGDELLVAGRAVVDGTSHLALLTHRDRELRLVTGTHVAPADHPVLVRAEDVAGWQVLRGFAWEGLLTPQVAAVVSQWCTDEDVSRALASRNPGVRLAILLVLPYLRP